MCGMTFGCSFSLSYVDVLDWVHTTMWKKVVRSILGAGIAAGLFILFSFNMSVDPLTRFVLNHALPGFFVPFCMYGLWPIVCTKINLVSLPEESTYNPLMTSNRSDYASGITRDTVKNNN